MTSTETFESFLETPPVPEITINEHSYAVCSKNDVGVTRQVCCTDREPEPAFGQRGLKAQFAPSSRLST